MILSKSALVDNIISDLSDNSTGQISPHDIRHNLLDIVDSVHLLTLSNNLQSLNFATPETTTTKGGSLTLDKLGLDGYFSVDNSAFGYAALRSNYQGTRNTAIGARAMGCNIYGEDNVAIGCDAAGGNTTGFANIALGNYSLNGNQVGNFNIAIGNGAGYYVNRDTSNKLFIASHPVDCSYICSNPMGSGLTPLVYGDLSELKFGIAVNSLHNYGTLQVSGAISPSVDNLYNLGHDQRRFRYLNIASGILFPNDIALSYASSSLAIESKGDFIPFSTNQYNLGSMSKVWNMGYFNNILVSGVATINNYVAINSATYLNKTLYLASSGGASPSGYLPDADLIDAGLIIKASGASYLRDYKFTFAPPDESLTCLGQNNAYSKASWNSNISLHIASGNHLKTSRVTSYSDLALITPSGCHGLFLQSQYVYVSQESILKSVPHTSGGHLAGVGNINFIANSGSSSDYLFTISTPESGTKVSQRFLSGTKSRIKDSLNSYKDKLNGFEFKYIDDSSLNVIGPLSDRFILGSYFSSSEMMNGITLMKANNEGVVGITNINPVVDAIIPKTTLNIRSTGNAIARLTAENQGATIAGIQLLGGDNCLNDGFEITYSNASGVADMSMYKDSGKRTFFRFYENNTLGLFTSSGTSNATFTIGDAYDNNVAISLRSASNNPSSSQNYGKIFIKNKIASNQSNSLYLLDSSGNVHDLVLNNLDTLDGRLLYGDANGNTFGGLLCPDLRSDIPSAYNNTAIGYKALLSITTGVANNAIGSNTASGITTGYGNIILGYNSANSITTGHDNIVIGSQSFGSTSGNVNYNIIIGNSGIGNGVSGDYNFFLGHTNDLVLLHGKLGPSNSDKNLTMPSGGKLFIKDINNAASLGLRTNIIEVLAGSGTAYPSSALAFKFSGDSSADLLLLKHHVSPVNITPTYASPAVARPYAELNGDLRLLGSLRFSNNTSLSSATFLDDIATVTTNAAVAQSGVNILSSRLNDLIVEGYAPNTIPAPESASGPTFGNIIIKNGAWEDVDSIQIVNRDITSTIHAGAYVVAILVNSQYRPLWVSAKDQSCPC